MSAGLVEAGSPRTAQVGMLVFAISDALGFAALFAAWAVLGRGAAAETAGTPWDATAALGSVSAALIAASALGRRGRDAATRVALGVALLAAGLFLALTAREYDALLAAGVRLGGSHADSVFFVLTGYHALHVAIAALALAWAITARPAARAAALPVLAILWHTIDAIWLAIALLVYR